MLEATLLGNNPAHQLKDTPWLNLVFVPKHTQGLIFTAGTMYRLLHALNIPVHVQEVCSKLLVACIGEMMWTRQLSKLAACR